MDASWIEAFGAILKRDIGIILNAFTFMRYIPGNYKAAVGVSIKPSNTYLRNSEKALNIKIRKNMWCH